MTNMNKQRLAVIAIATVLFSSIAGLQISPATAQPRTITVPDDYSTIQAAIGNASAGDTVYVKAGTYYCKASSFRDAIVINKSISLIGSGSGFTFIRPNWDGWQFSSSIIRVIADNVTVSGFTVDSGVYNFTFEDIPHIKYSIPAVISCISVTSNNCKILNNAIMNAASYEVIISEGKNSIISGNYITATLGSTSGSKSDEGIFFGASNGIIIGNTINNTGTAAIHLGSSASNVTVTQNTINNNGYCNYTTNPYDHRQGGIHLECTGPCRIYQNNITRNFGFGVEFDGANKSAVYSNNIASNDYGVLLANFIISNVTKSIGSQNEIYGNNFLYNSQNAVIQNPWYNSTTAITGTDVVFWDNGQNGNYWSDYQSKNPNASPIIRSNIWDTPYIMDSGNIDYHPLFNPVNITAAIELPTASPAPSVPELPTWIISLLMLAIVAVVATWKRPGK
jgi:parallel beta-helix repeat protein